LQRLKEGMDKYLEALAKGLHGREGEMFDVMYLATDPSVQGRGYGGALLNEITAEADKMNKSTWLQCSNYLNAHFYISHGFETVSEYMLGGDNPKWIALDHKPVLIQIVSHISALIVVLQLTMTSRRWSVIRQGTQRNDQSRQNTPV